MRIFILILSLIFSAAFVFLNILGFNGILTFNEFFLVNVIAEVLACLILGHFMYRTYANHKKLKKLQQEMTTRQASNVAQEQNAKKKHHSTFKKKNDASTDAAPSPQTSAQHPTAPRTPQQDPRRAPVREEKTIEHTHQQPPMADATQPMQPLRSKTADMDATTVYSAPFGK